MSRDRIIALPFGHDGERLRCKVKSGIAGSGVATLADWLRDVDVLILGAPGEASLVVLPWPVWQRLIVPKGRL